MNSLKSRSLISPLGDFVRRESFSGLLIIFSALLGLLFANSALREIYRSFLQATFSIQVSTFKLQMDFSHVINDGLMTIFFFLVGLEIKRELSNGHLATFRKALPSALAAIGGMVVPAVLFILISDSKSRGGWGIAVATDIALAISILTLVGSRAKQSLRPFLLGLAVIDDIGAILIIAVFYSAGLSFKWALLAMLSLLFVMVFRKYGINLRIAYILAGLLLWFSLYKAGIHPTIAGVILGLLAPATPLLQLQYVDQEELTNLESIEHVKASERIIKGSVSTVEWLEHSIQPWSAYLIVPLFALSNSGIVISKSNIQHAVSGLLFWAIVIGLTLGKPLGILMSVFLTKKFNLGDLPVGTNFKDILSTGMTAGIGFTVAIFIAKIAFEDIARQEIAILGVLTASLISGVFSLILFRIMGHNLSPEHARN